MIHPIYEVQVLLLYIQAYRYYRRYVSVYAISVRCRSQHRRHDHISTALYRSPEKDRERIYLIHLLPLRVKRDSLVTTVEPGSSAFGPLGSAAFLGKGTRANGAFTSRLSLHCSTSYARVVAHYNSSRQLTGICTHSLTNARCLLFGVHAGHVPRIYFVPNLSTGQ